METHGGRIDVRILGPVEAYRDGVALALGGRRQRALLALLVHAAGNVVATDRLAEELWAGEPTDAADTTIRSYVSRLRHALGDDIAITRSAAGYALDTATLRVDAVRFEELIRAGETALERGATRRASQQLRESLDMWAGRPFGDLADDGTLRAESERLENLRLRALEGRIEADLANGRSGDLIDELELLLREYPYRERLWEQLMLALYRADRQADALGAYRRARAVLDEQLGLEPGPELERLQLAILNHEVPTPTPPEERHNLPAPLTSFIGREQELTDVARLLGQARLVTLTGVGGVGKTRLALETARRAVADYPDGVFFVDLSPVTESARVPHQLAAVLDVQEMPERTLLDLLGDRVRDRELLLVLDNCEHVREGAADTAFRLLASAPRLRILATSREVLGVPGETDCAVPPLVFNATAGDLATTASSEAVDLFMARARAVNPALRDDSANLGDASMIVATLDGLPLAIELAAARAKALSLPDIAARLTDRFQFLVSWRRLTSARHRTLREAMDWSYELLGPDEQSLLARLSVFTGGFTVAAVSAVCLDGDEDSALRQVERLVDASLVVPIVTGAETRYRLLETVRQYAAERVVELGVGADDRRRHADFYLGLAVSANLGVDVEGEQRFDLVFAEQANLDAALAWSLEAGEVELGLRLAVALHDHWVTGRAAEGFRQLRAFLDAGGDLPSDLRARALLTTGMTMVMSGTPQGSELYEQALEEFEALGDEAGQANALARLVLDRQIMDAVSIDDLASARRSAEASLALFRKAGSRRGLAEALGALARVEWLEGHAQRAVDLAGEGAAVAAETGYWWWQLVMLSNLAEYALDAGRASEAERAAWQAVELARRLASWGAVVFNFAVIARIAAADGRLEEAGILWGAIEAQEQRGPIGAWDVQRADYVAKMPAFGDATFEAGRASGRRLTLDAASELAVDNVPRDLHARALLAVGLMSVMSGAERGTAIYHQALAEFDAIGDASGRAHALDRMAFDATGLGQLDRARAFAEESLTLHRQVGGRRGEAQALGALARIEWLEGRKQRAIELAVESVAAAAEGGYWWWQLLTLSNLAEYALDADLPIDAERFACDTIRLARRLSDRQSVAFMFAVLARIAAEDGRLERSGVLWGALEAEEQRGPIGMWERQRADYEAKVRAFGDPTFEAARATGRRLTLAAAMVLAVDAGPGAGPVPG